MGFLIAPGIIFILVLVTIINGIFIVRQQTNVIVERFGKFHKVCEPGLNIVIPYLDRKAAEVPLRILQLDVMVETKTKDNVFVSVPVSVQYKISNVVESFYKLDDPKSQIRSYIFDNVRSSLAKMNLDEAFSSKDTIAQNIENTLSRQMSDYGFRIVNTLVTDINPDERVRASMNSINAAQRERDAAVSLAEAKKLELVKEAEGEAEAKRLQGEGVAKQRKAIVEGLVQQYKDLRAAGINEDEVQEMLMYTLYMDTMSDVAKASQTQTLMFPSNPGGANDLMGQIRNSVVSAEKVGQQHSVIPRIK